MTSSDSTIRVLLVEDSKINRELLKRRLDRRGFDVDVAEDGLRGFEMALELEPDVVLMDMSLPVLDGWRATAQLRANAFDQPIIGLTAHALTSDRERAMNAGCTDFITKPVDFEHLVDSISRLASAGPIVAMPQPPTLPTPVRDRVPTAFEMASAGLCAAHAHDVGSARATVIALIDACRGNPDQVEAARDADAALEAMASRWRQDSLEYFRHAPTTIKLFELAKVVAERLGVALGAVPDGAVRSDPHALATVLKKLCVIDAATRVSVYLEAGVACLSVGPLVVPPDLESPTTRLLTGRVLADFSAPTSPPSLVCQFASISTKDSP